MGSWDANPWSTNLNKKEIYEVFCMLHISPALVQEIASVETKYYKYFVPKQFTHPFYFNKNLNYWHEESVKNCENVLA